MSSEITKPATPQERWKICKRAVSDALVDVVACFNQRLSDSAPYIQEIWRDKLWKHGDYSSFEDFCRRVLHVTRQRVYQVLENAKTKNLLGNVETSNLFDGLSDSAAGALKGLPPAQAAEVVKAAKASNPRKKATVQAIKKAKGKVLDLSTGETKTFEVPAAEFQKECERIMSSPPEMPFDARIFVKDGNITVSLLDKNSRPIGLIGLSAFKTVLENLQ